MLIVAMQALQDSREHPCVGPSFSASRPDGGAVKMGVGHHDREFFAAESGHRVRFPHVLHAAWSSHLTKHRVACQMAETVVQLFEMIDIDHHEGKVRRISSG